MTQILALMKLRLPMELIRGKVEITVCGDGERIWPENPRIVRDGFPLSVSLALADAIALIVAGVDAALVADSF